MSQKNFSTVNIFSFQNLTHFFPLTETTTDQSSVVESKDRILHTVKSDNETIINVKGDYGQGTPADQHLYTTRDGPSLDSQKKI